MSYPRFWYFHKTGSGNIYPLEIGYKWTRSENISHDKDMTLKACKTGCNLYGKNGGCPPYSPDFGQIQEKYPFSLALFSRLFTRFYPPKIVAGRAYVQWNFVKVFMERVIIKAGRCLEGKLEGFLLGAGPCRACGSKKCSFKSGNKKCRNPDKRVFSLESTGVLANKAMEQLFDIPLLWVTKDSLPEYMINLILVMTNKKIGLKKLDIEINDCFSSLSHTYRPKSKEEYEKLISGKENNP